MTQLEKEGFVLQFFRLFSPYDQNELAKQLSVPPALVSDWERGRCEIDKSVLSYALDLIGLSAQSFYWYSQNALD